MTDLEVKTDKQETLVELRCKVAALESAISAKDAILNIVRAVNGFDPILSNHDAVYIDDPQVS